MTEKPLVTGEMQGVVGKEGKPWSIEVDKTTMTQICDAINDSNPLWRDEEYARASKYGAIIAPPALLIASKMSLCTEGMVEVPTDLKRFLAGGGEWEYYKPIRQGDTITASTKISGITEKEGKSRKMLVVTYETSHQNQFSELVAVSRATILIY